MSLRTPLRRVLNHGAAHDGVSHWYVERITALALAPLCIWFAVSVLGLPTRDYAAVTEWVASGIHPVLLALTILLTAWHGWLGLQVVLEDYVHRGGQRMVLLLLSTFVHALLAACGLWAVLKIALRSPA